MRQLPLFLLLAWFVLDAFAPRLGMEQVSTLVWRHGWGVRVLAGVFMLGLGSHLLFKWPLGPA